MNDDVAPLETRRSETAPSKDAPILATVAEEEPTHDNQSVSPTRGWAPNRSRSQIVIGGAILVVAVLVTLSAWGLPPLGGGSETTNNAYIRGRTTVISPQVSGYLVEVPVTDFQMVRTGDLLARHPGARDTAHSGPG